jgi:hypothetical protein
MPKLQNCRASSLIPLYFQPHQHLLVNIPKNLSPILTKPFHTAHPDCKSPNAAPPIQLIARPNPKNFTADPPNPKSAHPSSIAPDKPPPTPLPHLKIETLIKTLIRLRKTICLPVFPPLGSTTQNHTSASPSP